MRSLALVAALLAATPGCLTYAAINRDDEIKPKYFVAWGAADAAFGFYAFSEEATLLPDQKWPVRFLADVGVGIFADALLAAVVIMVTTKPSK